MKKKFRDLLHDYRVRAFKISHNSNNCTSANEATKEILSVTEEALNNAYSYQFHSDPDPKRIETFTLIKNYTLEALLPPVVEKIMRRVNALEKQHVALVELVDHILEALSDDNAKPNKDVG